jgi:hypothetical protein
LLQAFKVSSCYCSSGIAKPLLALLTNINLYLVGVKSNYTYYKKLVMPYTELDAVLVSSLLVLAVSSCPLVVGIITLGAWFCHQVGPNLQTVLLVSADRQTQFLVITGDHSITEHLVARIEIAMRRAPTKPTLPAVRVLELEDMKGLARDISVLAVGSA